MHAELNMKHSLAWLALALFSASAVAQPVQWRVDDGGNGHWYEGIRNATPISWQAAQSLAAARGGALVSLTSAAENEFVAAYATRRPELWQNLYGGPWIGAFQNRDSPAYSEPSGGWEWVTGEPWGYQRWFVGEPNNGNVVQEHHAVLMSLIGEWGDFSDDAAGPAYAQTWAYLVEYSADCNQDGIVDKGQILAGDLLDVNDNGIPDGPRILVQPVDRSVDAGVPVTFIVEVAVEPECASPVSYQWQRRDPLVLDPQDPAAWIDLVEGGGFLNTRTAAIVIPSPTLGMATGFRCRISGGCGCDPGAGGFVYTNQVNFSLACPSDFNADGSVDGDDVIEFFSRWDAGC
jgi:hypothetical protein